MRTDFTSLKLFADHILNQLRQFHLLEFSLDTRASLIESLAEELNVGLLTEEDLQEETLEELQEKYGEIEAADITQNEAYIHARKELIKSFNGEAISGFYLAESLFKLAERVKNFLTDSSLVEEVYGTDEELVSFLVQKFKSYEPARTLNP